MAGNSDIGEYITYFTDAVYICGKKKNLLMIEEAVGCSKKVVWLMSIYVVHIYSYNSYLHPFTVFHAVVLVSTSISQSIRELDYIFKNNNEAYASITLENVSEVA